MENFEIRRRVYSVTQINRYVKSLLAQDGILSGIWICGEISNYKEHSSGLRYFTIKDAGGAIAAVMFVSDAAGLKFVPREGQQVEVQGSVSLYEKTGQYQFYVKKMEPQGRGALYQAFEELKEKLWERGLFDMEVKKPIPAYPRKVGLVTSPTGAAVRDMVQVAKRRHPGVQLILCPCLVQGDGAAASIARGIARLDREPEVDVIIVGRGGGSIEDLWAFNEEAVAMAVYQAETPIISAVGHETDVTIADFVADLRAATPSAAAELAVPEVVKVMRDIEQMRGRMDRARDQKMLWVRRQLQALQGRLRVQHPELKLKEWRQQVDLNREELGRRMRDFLQNQRQRLHTQQLKIELLNPWEQLKKGYALVTDSIGHPISTVQERRQGEGLQVFMKDGRLEVTVEDIYMTEEGTENNE